MIALDELTAWLEGPDGRHMFPETYLSLATIVDGKVVIHVFLNDDNPGSIPQVVILGRNIVPVIIVTETERTLPIEKPRRRGWRFWRWFRRTFRF